MNQEVLNFIQMNQSMNVALENMNFKKFKEVLQKSMNNTEIYDDYALEKFNSMKNNVNNFLFSELDISICYHFINQIMLELQLKKKVNNETL